MLGARKALFHHAQQFFETHLRGAFVFSDAEPYPAEPAPRIEGKRRYAYGREREIVEMQFGGFVLKLESPIECPPLGRVTLRTFAGEELESGPLDPATFAKLGAVICKRQPERIHDDG